MVATRVDGAGGDRSLMLRELRASLTLIEAAYVLSQEGVGQVSVLAVVSRAHEDRGVTFTASQAGLLLSRWGLDRRTIRGKSRLVLDAVHLASIRARLLLQVETAATEQGALTQRLHDEASRLDALEAEAREAAAKAQRVRQLREFVQAHQGDGRLLAQLEAEHTRLLKEAGRVQELEAECARLAKEAKARPAVLKRRKELQAAVREAQKEEAALTRLEQDWGAEIARLQKRRRVVAAWQDLEGAERAIEEARGELSGLEKQLGEKRGRFSRIFGGQKAK